MNKKRRSGDLIMKNWHMSLVMSIASIIALLVSSNPIFGFGFIAFMSATYVCRSIESKNDLIENSIDLFQEYKKCQ